MNLPWMSADIQQLSQSAIEGSLQDCEPHKTKLINHHAYSQPKREMIHYLTTPELSLRQELGCNGSELCYGTVECKVSFYYDGGEGGSNAVESPYLPCDDLLQRIH